MRQLFDTPLITRLQTVVDSINNGELLFPEFQRNFEWSDDQRLELFDSILKGLPIGGLLVWRTQEKLLHHKKRLGPCQLPIPLVNVDKHNYILDGLQRLTTLFAAFMGNEGDVDERGIRWSVYFDLSVDFDAPEKGFKLSNRGQKIPLTWLSMATAFDPRRLWEFQKNLFNEKQDALANKAERLANLFKDYPLALVPIVTNDLALVTKGFQRVNSRGTKMSQFHMLRALTYAESFDLSLVFQEMLDSLPGYWGSLDQQVLVNLFKAVHDYDVYKSDLADLVVPIADLEVLSKVSVGLRCAVDFLGKYCGVRGAKALPYAYQLIALARSATNGDDLEAHAAALRSWFWGTTFTEYFTGKTSSQLRVAFDHVRSICSGGDALPSDMPRTYSPLTRFSSASVRALARMHALASRTVLDSVGTPVDAQDLLTRGSEVFGKLFLDVPAEHSSNRVLSAPEDLVSLRGAFEYRLFPYTEELRTSHGLPPLDSDDSHSVDKMLSWRESMLATWEREFLEKNRVEIACVTPDHSQSSVAFNGDDAT
jgi:hypothetical protein